MTLTLGSLFAGIGGFDLGFERAGFRTVWQCEIDKAAQGVLRRHFPDAALHSDVRQVGAHNLEPVDVITFGSPCQDLSVAGKRAGLTGERSGLFHEAARIIRELRERYGGPRFAIWENVPGAFSSNGGADFAAVVQAMVDLGARDVCWRVLDSRYFGVAQRRRRVFLVADFGGERAEQILFEPESLSGDFKKGGKARKGAAAGTGAGASGGGGGDVVPAVTSKWAKGAGGPAGDECQNLVAQPVAMINMQGSKGNAVAQADGPSFTLNAMHGHDVHAVAVPAQPIPFDTTQPMLAVAPFDPLNVTSKANRTKVEYGRPCHTLHSKEPAVVIGEVQPIAFAQNTRDEVRLMGGDGAIVGALAAQPGMKQTTYVAQPIAFYPTQDPISSQDGVSHAMSSGNRQGCGTIAVCATGQVTHALKAEGAHGSEDGTGRGTPITVQPPMQVRRLTPTECERLQGFPDEWTSEAALPDGTPKQQADGPRYKQLGNAVTVNVAEWIGRRVAATLQP